MRVHNAPPRCNFEFEIKCPERAYRFRAKDEAALRDWVQRLRTTVEVMRKTKADAIQKAKDEGTWAPTEEEQKKLVRDLHATAMYG